MNRRSFLSRSLTVVGAVTLAPFLLPHCQECGERLLVELLRGDAELCSACRAAHTLIVPVEWSRQYTSVASLQELYRKTNTSIKQALKQQTSEMDWLRSYGGCAMIPDGGGKALTLTIGTAPMT